MRKILIGLLMIAAFGMDMAAEAQTKRRITFVAPTRRKETPQRISSSLSRGCPRTMPSVTLLTPPEHIGLTASKRTQVFIHFQGRPPEDMPVLLTLARADGSRAIVEKRIDIEGEGIARVELPIELEIGRVYQWSLTMTCQSHPNRLDENEEVSGLIERVDLPPALTRELDGASRWERANLYAAQGIWHDALALVQDTPEFDDLLQQVGIEIGR